MDDVKEIIENMKTYEIEREEAKTDMVSQGVLKPDGDLNYWEKPLTRNELAVILKRFKARGGA